MTYYVAILIQDGQWTETMGDHDKECVTFEIECWRDQGAKWKDIKLTQFKRVPTQRQLEAWVATVI